MSHDYCVSLPRGATALSAVCDCGISLSYSLTIFNSLEFSVMNVILAIGGMHFVKDPYNLTLARIKLHKTHICSFSLSS